MKYAVLIHIYNKIHILLSPSNYELIHVTIPEDIFYVYTEEEIYVSPSFIRSSLIYHAGYLCFHYLKLFLGGNKY